MSGTVVVLIVFLAGGTVASAQDRTAPQRGGPAPARSTVYKLEELRAPQIDALDRERTLFILPVGMIEVHGPHLPVGTDTLGLIYEANAASRRLSTALASWNIVMMPPISYGQGGANELGGRLIHPGTYAIRQSTLRSLVADLGAQVAQNGFKWIFVLNGHGTPTHNIAINESCDFVSETFRVTMLHVTGLLRADPRFRRLDRESIRDTFRPANSPPWAWTSMAALERRQAHSLFDRTWSPRSTRSCRAAWRGPSRKCARSRPHPDGKGIYQIPPRPARRTAGQSKLGGSPGSRN